MILNALLVGFLLPLAVMVIVATLLYWVPRSRTEYRPTVPHTWHYRSKKIVSIMDDLPEPDYKSQAEEWAEQVAREWREQQEER